MSARVPPPSEADDGGHRVRVEASPGPEYAPASAERSGLLTDGPLLVSWSASAAGRARRRLLALDGTPTEAYELRYAVLPAFDTEAAHVGDGFRASAIAVDVVFADGSRLLDDPRRDQHGLPADARTTFTRHALPPDQWSLRRVALPPGRTAVALEIVVDCPEPHAATGDRLRAWIDGAALVPARILDRSRPPSELVDTRRGSHASPWLSRGLTVPLVGVPHGALFVHPVTDAAHPHWNYTWNRHGARRRPGLQALSLSHTASVWIGDWGVLQAMPRPESAVSAPVAAADRETGFDHDDEVAHPHTYRVALEDGIVAEATTTDHVAVLRFRFAEAGGSIVLDRLGPGELAFTPDGGGGVLRGWIDGSSVHGQVVPRVFVDARVDGPVVGFLARPGCAGVLELDPHGDAVVELRVGTSLISCDLARRSRESEAAASFDSIRAATRTRWDALLSLVDVEGASDDQLVTLRSNLARLFAYPSRMAERDADGREVHADVAPLGAPRHAADRTGAAVRPGPLTANHGFWDTYRTAWPVLGLLTPDSARELLDGVVAHYRDGGWMPRWAAPGALDAMVGTSADLVVADAVATGVIGPGSLRDDAWLAALRDASVVPPHPAVGRKGMPAALYRGFVADDVAEGMSWGLEGALNDYGLYRLATILGEEAERRWFAARASGAARYFDADTGFFRGRSPEGAFRDGFDPRRWGGDYTETNAWGMAFSVPHDGAGLAALHGARRALRARLDAFFAEPETAREEFRGTYPNVIHEMVEARNVRLGMWGVSNQPAHHIPYLYLHAGHPAGTQRIVRDAVDRLFTGSEIGQGYPGDEDNGEMSAWWLLSAFGLYPLAPASGEWVIGSPLFDRMRWHLPAGDLEVIAHRSSPDHVYVQGVSVDGTPWTRSAIPHARLASGARIDIHLAAEPSAWATGPGDAPSSLSDELADLGWSPLRDALVGESPLVDDVGATPVSLDAGESVVLDLDAAATVELLTVGFVDAGSASWRVEGRRDGTWVLLDERVDEEVRWSRQTRPFLPRARDIRVHQVRLTASSPLRIAQLEALVAADRPGSAGTTEAVPAPPRPTS